jgi:hypothetical protein
MILVMNLVAELDVAVVYLDIPLLNEFLDTGSGQLSEMRIVMQNLVKAMTLIKGVGIHLIGINE